MDYDNHSHEGSTHEMDNLRAEFEAKIQLMQQQIDLLTKGITHQSKVDWKMGYAAADRLNIPQTLKIHVMDKYDGKRDPAVNMKTFVATMVPLKLGDEAVMQLFPRYLTGAAERWYHQTCGGKFPHLRISPHSSLAASPCTLWSSNQRNS